MLAVEYRTGRPGAAGRGHARSPPRRRRRHAVVDSGARVRLQGIDTPETVREGFAVETWGPQASQFTKDFIDRADNRVRLTFSLERKDRHDRFLAFVWDGEVMLNEELVRAGLAHARLDYRYSGSMKSRLARAQDEARRAGRGLWSHCTGIRVRLRRKLSSRMTGSGSVLRTSRLAP